MSKISKYAALIVVLGLALVFLVGTALAKAPRHPYAYTSYMAKCGELPPEEVIEDGSVVHLKGVVSYGRVFGDPYFEGEFENRFDVKLNMETGSGWVHGTTVIKPDAYDGTWQGGQFSGQIRSFAFSGRGVDFGTGELEGLVDIVRIKDISESELPAEWIEPCQGGAILGANLAQGRIIGKKLPAGD